MPPSLDLCTPQPDLAAPPPDLHPAAGSVPSTADPRALKLTRAPLFRARRLELAPRLELTPPLRPMMPPLRPSQLRLTPCAASYARLSPRAHVAPPTADASVPLVTADARATSPLVDPPLVNPPVPLLRTWTPLGARASPGTHATPPAAPLLGMAPLLWLLAVATTSCMEAELRLLARCGC